MSFNEFRAQLKQMLFSRRQAVFKELTNIACESSRVNVAWPDALLFLDENDLQLAILRTTKLESNPESK